MDATEHLQWKMGVTMLFFIFFHLLSVATAYECIEKCGPFGRTVYPSQDAESCLVAMPDNPTYAGGQIMPCEIEIQANCSSFCHLEIKFAKFNLPKCKTNLTYTEGTCAKVNSCEYIVIKETGTTEEEIALEEAHLIHGMKTGEVYLSQTNRVLLQFCYRSETFSARNIQLEYKTLDPVSAARLYLGPISVWVLGSLVAMLICCIGLIAKCPWLRPCLDPPQPKQTMDF